MLFRLDALSRSGLYRNPTLPMTHVVESLRERAAARGHVSPGRQPDGETSWAAHLAWLERRRDEACAPVAVCDTRSFFVAEGGRLMSCGTEPNNMMGVKEICVLAHGELPHLPLPTPTLLPSMA